MFYGILVKRRADAPWECVMTFDCSRKASEYREKHYSQYTNWCITLVDESTKKVERYEN